MLCCGEENGDLLDATIAAVAAAACDAVEGAFVAKDMRGGSDGGGFAFAAGGGDPGGEDEEGSENLTDRSAPPVVLMREMPPEMEVRTGARFGCDGGGWRLAVDGGWLPVKPSACPRSPFPPPFLAFPFAGPTAPPVISG